MEQQSYDVCLSFAGEDREYVEQVAQESVAMNIRVFYDRYEEVELWGKDLCKHLDEVYRTSATFCVIFISAAYARKLWTKHELRSAQARAFSENRAYILPVSQLYYPLLFIPRIKLFSERLFIASPFPVEDDSQRVRWLRTDIDLRHAAFDPLPPRTSLDNYDVAISFEQIQ